MEDKNMGFEFGTEDEKKEYIVNVKQDIPPTELMPNCYSHIVAGKNMLVSFLTMTAGSVFEVHTHPHEQIMTVLEGYCDQIIDGKLYHVEKGDCLYMAPNIPHGSILRDVDCVVIDVFSPAREAHLEKYKEQNPDAKVFFLDKM